MFTAWQSKIDGANGSEPERMSAPASVPRSRRPAWIGVNKPKRHESLLTPMGEGRPPLPGGWRWCLEGASPGWAAAFPHRSGNGLGLSHQW